MKRIIIFLVSFSFASNLHSQVNLQTGSALLDLPMFNWKDNKSKLNFAISLNYNSNNGLKVDEIASNVGQGWNLLAGGVISRMQVGEPDDQMPYNTGTTESVEDVYKYPAGFLYNPVNSALGCPIASGYYPIFGDQNHVYKQHNVLGADREQDYFSFQFGGHQGMFVLGKSGNNGILIGDSKVKISFLRNATTAANLHSRTTITSFTITDENGLIYTFNQPGLSKVLKMHPSIPGATVPSTPVLPGATKLYQSAFDEIPDIANPFIINNWYLTQIQDPLTLRSVSLNYIVRDLTNYAGDAIEYTNSSGPNVTNWPSVTEINGYVTIYHNISKTLTPFLTSIVCQDGYLINFNYDTDNPRIDLIGDFPLKSLNISYNGKVVSNYDFKTTYFILNNYGTPITQDQKISARLCLRSLQKSHQPYGAAIDIKDKEPPFMFDYFLGSNNTENFVPPPFYYAKDIRGYYNGSAVNRPINNTPPIPLLTTQLTDVSSQLFNFSLVQLKALCFFGYNPSDISLPYNYNTINFGFAQNGLLKSIIYPTGGKLEYQYQQNFKSELFNGPQDVQANQSSVIGTELGGGVHVLSTTQTDGGYSNSNLAPIKTVYNFVNQTGSQTSQWGYETPINFTSLANSYLAEGAVKHLASNCTYDYQYSGILSVEGATVVNKISVSLSDFVKSFLLSNIHDAIMSMAGVSSSYIGIVLILADYVFGSCDGIAQLRYNRIYQNSNIERNSLPILFSRVEVVPSSNLPGIGKTVYEFTDFKDYPIWGQLAYLGGSYNRMSMQQRSAAWAYGLPKKISVYNANGNIIEQTENSYDLVSKIKTNAGTDLSCNCFVDESASLRSDSWATYMLPQNVLYFTGSYVNNNISPRVVRSFASPYQMYTGRAELVDTYNRTFKPGDATNYLEKNTHYEYNLNNYQPNKITVTQSNGDKNIKEIYYSCDYTAPGILQTLKLGNMLNVPVAIYSSVLKASTTTPVYISASVTDFTLQANGDIKPSRILIGRTTTPIAGFVFNPDNPFNFPGLIPVTSFNYDGSQSANLNSVKDEGSHTITNLYNYDDRFVVAKIVNADAVLDKPAYSSFETDNDGGWTISGNSSRGALPCRVCPLPVITGFNVLSIDATSVISAPINFGKPYIVSYWSNNGPLIVSNSSLVKTGPVVNGFTYYEYSIPINNTTVNISCSGSNSIDELRLYPKTATMRTVSYDPLKGKITECDENNRLTYYEYDELWRLRFIKDDANNIIKMYEYNLDNTILYQSTAKTQHFTKSCAAGSAFSVDYNVTSGMYTSIISQDDADAKAQNDINVNGQAVANAGVCVAIPSVPVYCSFTPAANWAYITGNISATGSAVSFYIVEQNTNNYTSWTSPTLIATITGSCKPSVNRTISYTENGRNWTITFTPLGELYIQLISGSAPGAGFIFAVGSGTFNL